MAAADKASVDKAAANKAAADKVTAAAAEKATAAEDITAAGNDTAAEAPAAKVSADKAEAAASKAPADKTAAEEATADKGDKADGITSMAEATWKSATLDKHNALRANHSAPPLEWSDDCYAEALKQATSCEESNTLGHGFQEGTLGHHGQNAYMHSKEAKAECAVQAWYDELCEPGYDYSTPGHQAGTGHFSQVVWKDSKYVGMARSPDGRIVVANYFPAGNMTNPGYFEKNVLPPGAEMTSPLPPAAAEGSIVATEWNAEVDAALVGCPFDAFPDFIKKGFSDGATVTIEREATSIKITLKKGGSMSSTSGSWG